MDKKRVCRAMLLGRLVGGIALAFGAGHAVASDQVGQWHVDVMGTGISADDARSVDDDFVGGTFAVGYAFHEHWNVEVAGQFLNLEGVGPGVDIDQKAISANVLNIYNRDGIFSPYLLAGIGILDTDPSIDSHDHHSQLQLGFGALTDLGGSGRVALRTEAVYRYEDASTSLEDWLFNIGLRFAFGGHLEKK